MLDSNTDKEWEKFGKDDPYFGVITDDRYRKENLTDEGKEAFFESGINYIDELLKKIRQRIDPAFTIRRALDYGCGVGRLLIPLAGVAEEVTGVDVSESMLKEVKKNCEARSARNVVLAKTDDSLSLLKGKYDFIHSFIVFQHIPVTRGERIFEKLVAHLADEGVCVVHFTYASDHKNKKLVAYVKRYVPFSGNFYNWLQGRKFFAPRMQMNAYNLNHLFLTIQKAEVRCCYVEFTDHGGELGIVMYFRKNKMA